MKSALALSLALLAITPMVSEGAGFINLGWDDCALLGPGTADKAFTCGTNSAANVLYASYQPPVIMSHFVGLAGVIDIVTNQATLSPWWQMQTGGCRSGLATLGLDFTAGPFTCADFWQGRAFGGLDYAILVRGPNTARIRTVMAVPEFDFGTLDPAHEYYGYSVRISNLNTVGSGACAGCLDAACIVLNSIELNQIAGFGDHTVTTGPQQFVTWRGGAGTACPAATPTRARSWGQIKGLYR